MTEKLIQRHLLHGTQEFELTGDELRVTTSGLFKGRKTLTYVLATLNPEPVVNQGRLEFYGRVKCGPMLSFLIDKPDRATFTAFTDRLTARIQAEYSEFTGGRELPPAL